MTWVGGAGSLPDYRGEQAESFIGDICSTWQPNQTYFRIHQESGAPEMGAFKDGGAYRDIGVGLC